MGWLNDLFASKPGGTTVGNIVRDLTKELTGGNFGTGSMLASTQAADKLNLSDAAYLIKYGTTKTGASGAPSVLGSVLGTVKDATTWAIIKQYWYLVLIPFVLMGLLMYFFQQSRSPRKRRY